MFWNKKKIYLDYAAATPVSDSVRKAMEPFWSDDFFHPGALYSGAVSTRHAIENARISIAKNLSCQERNIIFTGGGTESNNMAIQGVIRAWQKRNPNKKPHVIISAIEHAGVRDVCLHFEKNKEITLSLIPVDSSGCIDLKFFKDALIENTALVSIGYANSEIGTIQPIEEVIKTIRHFKKVNHGNRDAEYPVFHTDAIAAVGYLPVLPSRINADLVSISAAKIYGPKGSALLYIRDGIIIEPLLLGGGQERGMRSGTENVPLIIGLAQALDDAVQIRVSELERLQDLQKYFFNKLNNVSLSLKDRFSFLKQPILINGSIEHRLPNNINISIENISSEQLVLEMDARGIFLSSRAACSERDNESSYVVDALTSNKDKQSGSIRITLGKYTSQKDIDITSDVLQKVLEKLYTTYEEFNDTI